MARKKKLTEIYRLNEDQVAVRALGDILQKAIVNVPLTGRERHWAKSLHKAVGKSGPDHLMYPELSMGDFAPSGEAQPAPADKKAAAAAGGKKGIDIDSGEIGQMSAPAGANASQDAWDSFAPKQGPVGKFGGPEASDNPIPGDPNTPVPSLKKPGMLSRLFSKATGKGKEKPAKEPKPGKAVAQSTWDDLSNQGPKAPEKRGKNSTAKQTWDRYANDGPMGDRDTEDELGPAGRRKAKK